MTHPQTLAELIEYGRAHGAGDLLERESLFAIGALIGLRDASLAVERALLEWRAMDPSPLDPLQR